jgi:hypothetical protein
LGATAVRAAPTSRSAPGEPSAGRPPGGTATVDPAALSAAIAAIAPSIAPDHRKSLAVVLRALAEALDAP